MRRTKYNQYDSLVKPLQRWILGQGVDVRFATKVTDVDFDQRDPARRRAAGLHVETRDGSTHLVLGENDVTLITLGSITADSTYAGNDTVPELIRDRGTVPGRCGTASLVKRETSGGQTRSTATSTRTSGNRSP